MINYDKLKENLCQEFKLNSSLDLRKVLYILRHEGTSMLEIARGSKGEISESSVRRLLRRFNIG